MRSPEEVVLAGAIIKLSPLTYSPPLLHSHALIPNPVYYSVALKLYNVPGLIIGRWVPTLCILLNYKKSISLLEGLLKRCYYMQIKYRYEKTWSK